MKYFSNSVYQNNETAAMSVEFTTKTLWRPNY